ncbi:MAG: efflux RND transporter permease subunit, partial [Acidobacteria bacterium]|nr:efflux RND transporter permease subunit [Acidobacteriota bacterium]
MRITRAAIDRSRVTLVLLVVLAAAGLRSYDTMPQAEDPGFIIRFAVVTTRWPGASPQRVEQLVTDKLEKAIQEIPELDVLTSESKTGASIISVGIKEQYTRMRPIWDDLRRKVERVIPDLPTGAGKPQVNDEYGDVFGTVLGLTGDGFSFAELKDVAEEVRDELLLLEDVAKVDIYGAQEERIFVEYSNSRLAELGLSPKQLQGILAARNIVNSGGELRTPLEAIVLEPTGNFESLEQIGQTLIPVAGGTELLHLKDVARVRRGYVDPPRSKVRVSGEEGLVLAVAMREGGNIVELGKELRREVARVQATYPHGIELTFLLEQGRIVEDKVADFVNNLLQAVGIVLLVMLVSLGPRTGLVVASLIPMAILAAFIFMPMAGVGIDQMSLASLIIALGLLVDNAIVVSESIMVQMAEGKPAKEAAVSSASELAVPLLVSSLTTAAAFLPIFLAESAVGEYTAPLFKVVTITLLCSWALAMTMIPLFSVLFLRVKKGAEESTFDSVFYRRYRGILLRVLRHPAISLLAVSGIFVLSLQLFRFVPVIFFPDNDRPTLTAEMSLPTGTPLAHTETVVDEVEAALAQLSVTADGVAAGESGVTGWVTYLGDGGPRFYLGFDPEQANSGYAIVVANATDVESTWQAVERLRGLQSSIPGLKVTADPLSAGPPGGKPVSLRISGRDQEATFRLVDRVKAQLASMDGPINISDDWGARTKKILVEVDADRAQRAGVTHQDVAQSLETVFSGFATTEYREGDEVIPVTLRSTQGGSVDLETFGSINVFSQSSGRSVPVEQVATAEVVWQPGVIRRRNRLQTVTVEADLAPGWSAARFNPRLISWLQEESASWPLGYSWEIGGEDEASKEANASIAAQLPIAFLAIVLLLVGQFNSLRRPLIILLTIPLGIIGVVVGLLALRSTFGFMTLLGVISLAGIVINNAIVLIDRIELEIKENGASPQRAIIESAQRRLRPILL